MTPPGPDRPTSPAPGTSAAGDRAALLTRLTESAPLGIFLTDPVGRPVYVNPRMAAITGRDADQLTGDDWALMVHPDDRTRVLAAMRAFIAGGDERLRQEYRICLPDGTERRVATETARALGPDGGPEGFAGTMEDISERHALETRAREAQKMEAVGRLAGGIAHDFNNLLTVIRTYTEFLASDLPDGDPRRADAHQVLAATERAAALTRQLLAFGRRQPPATRPLDINRAVRDLRPVLTRVVGPAGRVELALADEGAHGGTPHAKIDPGQLEQVLLNLAQNAREAMPDGGTLTVRTSVRTLSRDDVTRHAMELTAPVASVEPGDYIVLALEDEGRGMDDATQARMFEPFFTTKLPGAGVGLGLATVWGIVTQAGGHLRVETGQGAGTTMEVWLPLVERHAPRRTSGAISTPLPTPGSGMPAVTPSETILLVEDEPAVRTSVRRILERAGYRVLEARHGLDARLQWEARRHEIALVLTDVEMPEIDGTQLASTLRAQSPDVRFVFMTGYTGEHPRTTRRFGPHDVMIEKPFEARTLLDRVRQALDN
jgi:two-component system, cell cycle sensor histidine kinase and response regulator CckA